VEAVREEALTLVRQPATLEMQIQVEVAAVEIISKRAAEVPALQ
jgi:hypothetical protein